MKKPEFYTPLPRPAIHTKVFVKSTPIDDGEDISQIQKSDPSNTLEFESTYDRVDENYSYALVEYRTEIKLNEKYAIELKEYDDKKTKYETAMVEYNDWLKQEAIKRAEKDTEARRKRYEALRKEFESK